MKLSLPLTLKVSIWLLLNLVLLGIVGAAFLFEASGFSWDALATGTMGSRLQTTAKTIAANLNVEGTNPNDVLARTSEIYGDGVQFALFDYMRPGPGGGTPTVRQIAGPAPAMTLPAAVTDRLIQEESRRPQFGGNRRGGQSPPPMNLPTLDSLKSQLADHPLTEVQAIQIKLILDDYAKARTALIEAQSGSAQARSGLEKKISEALSPNHRIQFDEFLATGTVSNPDAASSNRFLVRVTEPDTSYYAGVQMPWLRTDLFPAGPGGFQGPPSTTLMMHLPSLGAGALLFDLNSWLGAAAAAVGLSILFWLPLVHSITRSLRQLTTATEQIADGRFDTRVDAKRRDELGRLGGAVNVMAERLDRAATGQKRFLGDIAHELGSPVGRLQVAVGILQERAGPELQPAVADVEEEVQQMSALVGELLAFTKAGLKARGALLGRVELRPLLVEVLAHEAAEGKVSLAVPEGLAVEADAALLGRALANLVRNALRYAGDAGPITVSAQADGREVAIAVEDCGAGVPADTLGQLGEPFFRPELARTRDAGGVGLGLAIVRGAAEACRGSVRFSNREPHGFRAEVRLLQA